MKRVSVDTVWLDVYGQEEGVHGEGSERRGAFRSQGEATVGVPKSSAELSVDVLRWEEDRERLKRDARRLFGLSDGCSELFEHCLELQSHGFPATKPCV